MISNRIRPGDAIADVVGGEAIQKRNLELLLNEIADQLETLQASQTQQDARISQNENDISALQTAVADHETRITALENP